MERSFELVFADSLGAKPKLSGEGRGVVERLLRVGLGAWLPAGWLGRVPIGATFDPIGAVADFWAGREGDSPGEDAEVWLDCWAPLSNKLNPAGLEVGLAEVCVVEFGEEVLSARERCWGPSAEDPAGTA